MGARRLFFASGLFFLFLGPTLAFPASDEAILARLRGLATIKVSVGSLGPGIEQPVIRREQVQTDVELSLRKAGIRIDEQSPALLQVVVSILEASRSHYAYSIRVELLQPAVLKRDPSIATPARTWERGATGIMNKGELVSDVRQTIKEFLDDFCNDYLAANEPKRASPSR
jgi:hypothetical protein